MRYNNEMGSKWKDFVPPFPLGVEASLPPEKPPTIQLSMVLSFACPLPRLWYGVISKNADKQGSAFYSSSSPRSGGIPAFVNSPSLSSPSLVGRAGVVLTLREEASLPRCECGLGILQLKLLLHRD